MKKYLSLVVFAFSLLCVAPAQAHWHGGYGGWHHGGGWIAPFALGAAVMGTAVYASTPSYVVQQQPYVVSPPVAALRTGYFCQTAQQFYPNVQSCPVPWQVVNY